MLAYGQGTQAVVDAAVNLPDTALANLNDIQPYKTYNAARNM